MVNKSAPAKQAAAWQFLKFLDDAGEQATWAVGTGYVPIRKTRRRARTMKDYWAKNPGYKVAYDQLLSGPDSIATAGSVIGPNIEVQRHRARRREQHVPRGRRSEVRDRPRPRRRPPPRSSTTTPGSAPDTTGRARSTMLCRQQRRRGVDMRSWRSRRMGKRWVGSGLAMVVLTTGLVTATAVPEAGAANSTSCPVAALKKASKPVEITILALDEPRRSATRSRSSPTSSTRRRAT